MDKLLTDAELTQIRNDIEANCLPDICYVLTKTFVSDGQGGGSYTAGTSGTLTCRIDMVDEGMEKLTGGAIEPYTTWMMTIPHDATITSENQIYFQANTYNVIGLGDDGSWLSTKRVLLKRVP